MRKILATLFLGVILAGCATNNANSLAQNDPYEPTNRAVFNANQVVYDHSVWPFATYYNHAVPDKVRESVHNFLTNLDKPVVLGNDLLQGKCVRAQETVERFALNSTLGFAGLFDIASDLKVPDHSADFGQTLAVWGTGEGPYLVVPLIGPDSPRDVAGAVGDIAMDPLTYLRFHGADTWSVARAGTQALDTAARSVSELRDIERNSIDYYATMRSLYRQYRANEIRDGAPAPDELEAH